MGRTAVILFVLLSNQISSQENTTSDRLEYFKNHWLFIVMVEFEHKKLNQLELDSIFLIETAINRNLQKCLDTFWDLNDTTIFIQYHELKEYKKKYPAEIFLNFKTDWGYGYHLKIPRQKKMLNNVSPRLMGDTSLLDITQEIRQLRYNVIHGSVNYSGENTYKEILILEEPAFNDYHEKFIEEIKTKHPGSYTIVSMEFLIDAIFRKDPQYIYVNRLSLINIEDGSLIPY